MFFSTPNADEMDFEKLEEEAVYGLGKTKSGGKSCAFDRF